MTFLYTKPNVEPTNITSKTYSDQLLHDNNFVKEWFQRLTFKTAINTTVEFLNNYTESYLIYMKNYNSENNSIQNIDPCHEHVLSSEKQLPPTPDQVSQLLYSYIELLHKQL